MSKSEAVIQLGEGDKLNLSFTFEVNVDIVDHNAFCSNTDEDLLAWIQQTVNNAIPDFVVTVRSQIEEFKRRFPPRRT